MANTEVCGGVSHGPCTPYRHVRVIVVVMISVAVTAEWWVLRIVAMCCGWGSALHVRVLE